MNYYTYAYFDENNIPYYIGKGKGNRAWDKNHSVRVPTNDKIILLKKNLSENEAYRHEVYIISILGRKNKKTGILENKTDGGDAPPVFVSHTEETKQKMRNRKHSEETKKKIGEKSKGRIFPEDAKLYLSNLYKGRKLSDKTKEKLSKSLCGKPKSEETKRKMSKAKKQMSEETKRKMSEAAKIREAKKREAKKREET
jgi:hypothetical protein